MSFVGSERSESFFVTFQRGFPPRTNTVPSIEGVLWGVGRLFFVILSSISLVVVVVVVVIVVVVVEYEFSERDADVLHLEDRNNENFVSLVVNSSLFDRKRPSSTHTQAGWLQKVEICGGCAVCEYTLTSVFFNADNAADVVVFVDDIVVVVVVVGRTVVVMPKSGFVADSDGRHYNGVFPSFSSCCGWWVGLNSEIGNNFLHFG